MGGPGATVEAVAVAVAARVPVLLWGAPGTGKSSVVRALAAAAGLPCETVIASIRDPSDFAGLPVVDTTDGTVRFAPPRWARRLADAGEAVLFLDEISTAPPAVQAALLRVVLERVVGDLELPDGVAVVAAANPPEQSADGWDLSAPLANRFCHLQWQVDAATVAAGLAAGFTTDAIPLGADALVAANRPGAAALVSAFLTVRPSLTVDVPRDAASAGRAWPSPRTWEMAIDLMAAAAAFGATPEATVLLVRGAVGDGAGAELLAWQADLDLPDPEAVLADPDAFVLPERGDRAFATLAAVAAAVAADPTPERWLAAWRVLGRAGERAIDVAAVAARSLARCRPEGAPPPPEAAMFADVLRAAGVL